MTPEQRTDALKAAQRHSREWVRIRDLRRSGVIFEGEARRKRRAADDAFNQSLTYIVGPLPVS